MIVAVTGATGHLGGYLVPHLIAAGHLVIPVWRTMPLGLHADACIHLASPRDWRDHAQVDAVRVFNRQVKAWRDATGRRVIAAGSWWQYAGADAEALPYTRMKAEQQEWADVTVVLFSIYGTTPRSRRGFIPELVAAANGGEPLTAVGRQVREWLHPLDACTALEAGLAAPDGVYEAASWDAYSPYSLALACGLGHLPALPQHPDAHPFHKHPRVPGWAARRSVLSHIHEATRKAA